MKLIKVILLLIAIPMSGMKWKSLEIDIETDEIIINGKVINPHKEEVTLTMNGQLLINGKPYQDHQKQTKQPEPQEPITRSISKKK